MIQILQQIETHPVFAIAATVAAYWLAAAAWRRLGSPALLHPVLVATLLVAGLLLATGMSYERYLDQTSLMNEALGIMIVLLAVPLCRQARLLFEAGGALALCLVAGSLVALATALFLPGLLGAEESVLATLAPKSTTAAVAVQISEGLGGAAGLTAVVVISTGIFGAMFGPALLDAFDIRDERARGFALGVASHAIGTARAFQISETTGSFASLGMILNAVLTIVLVPLVLALGAS